MFFTSVIRVGVSEGCGDVLEVLLERRGRKYEGSLVEFFRKCWSLVCCFVNIFLVICCEDGSSG